MKDGHARLVNKVVKMTRDVRKPKKGERIFGTTLSGVELTRESIAELVKDTLIQAHEEVNLDIKTDLDFAVRSTGVVARGIVDLRSPTEYAEDHLPGARNVPLFDDAQRALVGTVYHRRSPSEAYEQGLRLVESGLGEMLEEILGRSVPSSEWLERFHLLAATLRGGLQGVEAVPPSPEQCPPLLLYCWRGGLRSTSMVALLQALGVTAATRLEGGYKAYRAGIRRRLAVLTAAEIPLIVLRGPTGVGKTRILRRLESASPGSTLDLEGMARHRSSVLGDVGLEPAGQKEFESALCARLDRLGPPPWFIEGESRKVGDRVLPEALWQAMEKGMQVRLSAPLPHRVELLAADYLASPESLSQLDSRLSAFEQRLGRRRVVELRELLAAGAWRRVATILLERWYDPRYGHHDARREWTAQLDATSPRIVEQLLDLRGSATVLPG